MNAKHRNVFLCTILLLFFYHSSFGQGINIKLAKGEIASNEPFQITIEGTNQGIDEHSSFPEIPGLRKAGTSSSTSVSVINGRQSSVQRITQNYLPTGEGTFTLKPFNMVVNGQKVSSPGLTIRVGPPARQQVQALDPFGQWDPFAAFFGNSSPPSGQAREFVDVRDDAFFSVSTNKKEVYVGEGFTMTIAFYVALNNRAQLDFYKVGEQLGDILKKVRPAQCWEENFNIEQIEPEYVTINGEQYRQYKLFQATFFPLSVRDIQVPAVDFQMIKYKEARNPGFFGRNLLEELKTYSSKSTTVRVKSLPPHPLRDQVNVGRYQLAEQVSDSIAQTGNSIRYNFTIQGEGNIAAITEPRPAATEDLLFFSPSVRQQVNRSNGTVYGGKSFEFHIEPQEPGDYALQDFFQWVYFDPQTGRYDTLVPQAVLRIQGKSRKDQAIAANDIGGLSELLAEADAEPVSLGGRWWAEVLLHLSLLALLGGAVIVLRRRTSA